MSFGSPNPLAPPSHHWHHLLHHQIDHEPYGDETFEVNPTPSPPSRAESAAPLDETFEINPTPSLSSRVDSAAPLDDPNESKSPSNSSNEHQNVLESTNKLVQSIRQDIHELKSDHATAVSNILIHDLQAKLASTKTKTNWNKRAKHAKNALNLLSGVVRGVKNIKEGGGGAASIASGICDMVGGIAPLVGGPYGELVGAVFGLAGAVIGLCLGGQKSVAEQIKGMIDELKTFISKEFDDFKNDDIAARLTEMTMTFHVEIIFLEALITKQGFSMEQLNEMQNDANQLPDLQPTTTPFALKEVEQQQLTTFYYRQFGLRTLAILAQQIDKYKYTKDQAKAQRIAKYVFHYSQIAMYRRLLLLYQCILLKRNGLDSTFHAVYAVLNDYSDDKQILELFTQYPEANAWLWSYLKYTSCKVLSWEEKECFRKYHDQCGCANMFNPDLVPLHLYHHRICKDLQFLTKDLNEIGVTKVGETGKDYMYDGILAWVYPYELPGCAKLCRSKHHGRSLVVYRGAKECSLVVDPPNSDIRQMIGLRIEQTLGWTPPQSQFAALPLYWYDGIGRCYTTKKSNRVKGILCYVFLRDCNAPFECVVL
eukprot:779764_1